MASRSAIAELTALTTASLGVFRGTDAVERGVTRKQLAMLRADGVIERVLPDTYRIVAVPCSHEQELRAALQWAGASAVGACRSAGVVYGLAGVAANIPEICVRRSCRARSALVAVHRVEDVASLRVRRLRGIPITGVEPTLIALAAVLDDEALEIACEDARRRALTSVAALRAYMTRWPGRPGAVPLRELLHDLDPVYPSRSTLEVKTRRLLVANGFHDFVREFPLDWRGHTYRYDFGFRGGRTILETNGRRWHDDPLDYERDNEKWSVPGRLGYRIVFATWAKVLQAPNSLIAELRTTLAA